MKNKKLIVGLMVCSLFLFTRAVAWSEEEMAKPMKLTLDVAKAVVEGKDVGEGLKAVAKDELSNWMWDSIGGYEKIVFQNSEAEIPGVREKAKKIWDAIQSIDKAATAIAEGKYDDALISSVDVVVGAVDHPAASALWAAVKMTYESHKLVKDTQAELEIETLYGIMSNDRRMMGVVDPKSDQPPMIPETATMSDYFYEKYVMTNDSTRQMLKSYVTKVVGDDWPEESWGDYIKGWMAIGSGVDTSRSAEIEAMGTEWKTKARTWISMLIKDVNKQAKVAWGETRVRQQLAEFKRFSERAAKFYNGDFEQMLKEFNAIKQYQKEESNCSQILAESPKAYTPVEKAVNEMKDSDVKNLGSWRAQIEEWQLKLLSASSKMQIIRKNELAASLSSERNRWMKLDDRIGQIIAQKNGNPEQVIDSVSDEGIDYSSMGNNSYQNTFFSEIGPIRDGYYSSLFVPKLKPFQFGTVSGTVERRGLDRKKQSISLTGDPERVMAALMDALNTGDFNGAQAIIVFWNETVAQAMSEHFKAVRDELRKVSGEPAALVAAQAALDAASKQYEEAVKPLYAQLDQLGAAASNYNWNDPRRKPIENQMGAIYNQIYEMGRALSPYYRAAELQRTAWSGYTGDSIPEMGKEALTRLEGLAGALWTDKSAELQDAYSAYKGLADVLVKQMEAYAAKFDAIEKQLPDESMFEHYNKWAEEEAALVSGNAYTFFVAAKERGDKVWVHSMPSVFLGMAQQIRDGIIDESRPMGMVDGFYGKEELWKKVIKEWQDLPKMSAEDANEIRVLVDPKFDPEAFEKRIAKAVLNTQNLMSSFPSKLKKVAQQTQTDRENREKDADKLEAVGKRLQAFFNGLKAKKLIGITYDLDVILPPAGEDGMIIADQPFKHYMTAAELKKIADPIRALWNQHPDAGFAGTYAPGYVEKFMQILSLPGIPAAREENFINPTSGQAIYKSDLKKALGILKAMQIPETDYEKKMAEVAALVPGLMRVVSQKEIKQYDQQARMVGMASADEYLQKTRGKGLSAPEYRLRENVLETLGDPGFQNELGQQYVSIAKITDKIVEENWSYNLKKQQDIAAAENARVVEEYRKKQEEEITKQSKESAKQSEMGLAGYYGYSLYDVRLNSYSLQQMSGEVVYMSDELSQGQMTITARLAQMDRVAEMLISEDGGRTWAQLATSQAISYTFTPIPEKTYQPILRIKTTDQEDIQIPFFRNVQRIVYRNTTYREMIVDALRRFSTAYEQNDVGTVDSFISSDFIGGKSELIEGIRLDHDLFTDIRLTIYINKLEKRNQLFIADTKWDKYQIPRKTGQQQQTSGKTTFVFLMENGAFKLQNLRGNLMVATLSPQIAQSSGLSQAVVDDITIARDNRNPEQPGAGTTKDAGGVTSSSSSNLTVRTSPVVNVPGFPGVGFDFTANAETTPGFSGGTTNDVDFEGDLIFGQNFKRMTGETFDGLTTAPTSGYSSGGMANDGAGAVYAFITREGYYGKLEILSFAASPGGNLQFKFVVQTDGTTNIATQ